MIPGAGAVAGNGFAISMQNVTMVVEDFVSFRQRDECTDEIDSIWILHLPDAGIFNKRGGSTNWFRRQGRFRC